MDLRLSVQLDRFMLVGEEEAADGSDDAAGEPRKSRLLSALLL